MVTQKDVLLSDHNNGNKKETMTLQYFYVYNVYKIQNVYYFFYQIISLYIYI